MLKFKLFFVSLLFFSSFLFSAPINTDKTQQAVVEGVVASGAKNFTVETITDPAMGDNYLNASGFVPSGECTAATIRCPSPKAGYFTRAISTNLETGDVYCAIYTLENIDRPMYFYKYTNDTCKSKYKADTDAATAANQAAASSIGAATSEIQQARESIKNTFRTNNANGNNFIDLTKLIMAVATQDGEIIDIASTIANAEITTNSSVSTASPYTTSSTSSGNSATVVRDLAKNALSKKGSSLFMFYPEFQKILEEVLFMFLAVTIAIAAVAYGAPIVKKAWNSEQSGFSGDLAQYGVMLFATIVFFLFPAIEQNINAGEMKLTQTKFQQLTQSGIKQAGDFSQRINIAAHDAIFKALIKERGFSSTESIFTAFANKTKYEKLLPQYQDGYKYCTDYFDPNKVRAYVGGGDYLFPISEQELHTKWVQNNPNVKTSPYFDLLRNPNQVATNSTTGRTIPTITQCGEWERGIKTAQTAINANAQVIKQATSGSGNAAMKEGLTKIIQDQYKAIYEYGWMSAAFLPSTVFAMEMVTVGTSAQKEYFRNSVQDGTEAGTRLDGMIQTLTSYVPFFAMPGVSSMVDISGSIGEATARILGAPVKLIPFAGDSIAEATGYTGKLMGSIFGTFIGVASAKAFLEALPLILLTGVSILMFIILFVQVFVYFFVSPFAIMLAVATKEPDKVLNFMKKLVVLMVKILMFPVSIFLAINAHFLILDIGNWIVSQTEVLGIQAMHNTPAFSLTDIDFSNFYDSSLKYIGSLWLKFWGPVKWYIFVAVLDMFVLIISALASYKILTALPSWIMETLGIEGGTDRMDTMVEEIKGAASQYGARV